MKGCCLGNNTSANVFITFVTNDVRKMSIAQLNLSLPSQGMMIVLLLASVGQWLPLSQCIPYL